MSRESIDIAARDRVIVALDCEADEALALADALQGRATWLKVGMTLYYAAGLSMVAALKDRGFKVFLDLKFHDIPAQVKGAARSAVRSGADMVTAHAIGGAAMMQACAEGAAEGAELAARGQSPITLGITVLTSMDARSLAQTGVTRPLADQVMELAGQARAAGLSGVVASPQEAQALRRALGPDAYIVTPGVRPAGAALDDQKRVATPREAVDNGASHIVVGRPITKAADPVSAFEDIVAGLES